MNIYSITSQEVLDQISRHCPSALSVFLQCINRADEDGSFYFTKNLVEDEMCISWTKFKNHIRKLSSENLLEWHMLDGGISITMMDLDDEH